MAPATGSLNTPSVAASDAVESSGPVSPKESQERDVRPIEADSGALGSPQVAATNPASGDDLGQESANVADRDSLDLSSSSGILSSLLDERECHNGGQIQPVSF